MAVKLVIALAFLYLVVWSDSGVQALSTQFIQSTNNNSLQLTPSDDDNELSLIQVEVEPVTITLASIALVTGLIWSALAITRYILGRKRASEMKKTIKMVNVQVSKYCLEFRKSLAQVGTDIKKVLAIADEMKEINEVKFTDIGYLAPKIRDILPNGNAVDFIQMTTRSSCRYFVDAYSFLNEWGVSSEDSCLAKENEQMKEIQEVYDLCEKSTGVLDNIITYDECMSECRGETNEKLKCEQCHQDCLPPKEKKIEIPLKDFLHSTNYKACRKMRFSMEGAPDSDAKSLKNKYWSEKSPVMELKVDPSIPLLLQQLSPTTIVAAGNNKVELEDPSVHGAYEEDDRLSAEEEDDDEHTGKKDDNEHTGENENAQVLLQIASSSTQPGGPPAPPPVTPPIGNPGEPGHYAAGGAAAGGVNVAVIVLPIVIAINCMLIAYFTYAVIRAFKALRHSQTIARRQALLMVTLDHMYGTCTMLKPFFQNGGLVVQLLGSIDVSVLQGNEKLYNKLKEIVDEKGNAGEYLRIFELKKLDYFRSCSWVLSPNAAHKPITDIVASYRHAKETDRKTSATINPKTWLSFSQNFNDEEHAEESEKDLIKEGYERLDLDLNSGKSSTTDKQNCKNLVPEKHSTRRGVMLWTKSDNPNVFVPVGSLVTERCDCSQTKTTKQQDKDLKKANLTKDALTEPCTKGCPHVYERLQSGYQFVTLKNATDTFVDDQAIADFRRCSGEKKNTLLMMYHGGAPIVDLKVSSSKKERTELIAKGYFYTDSANVKKNVPTIGETDNVLMFKKDPQVQYEWPSPLHQYDMGFGFDPVTGASANIIGQIPKSESQPDTKFELVINRAQDIFSSPESKRDQTVALHSARCPEYLTDCYSTDESFTVNKDLILQGSGITLSRDAKIEETIDKFGECFFCVQTITLKTIEEKPVTTTFNHIPYELLDFKLCKQDNLIENQCVLSYQVPNTAMVVEFVYTPSKQEAMFSAPVCQKTKCASGLKFRGRVGAPVSEMNPCDCSSEKLPVCVDRTNYCKALGLEFEGQVGKPVKFGIAGNNCDCKFLSPYDNPEYFVRGKPKYSLTAFRMGVMEHHVSMLDQTTDILESIKVTKDETSGTEFLTHLVEELGATLQPAWEKLHAIAAYINAPIAEERTRTMSKLKDTSLCAACVAAGILPHDQDYVTVARVKLPTITTKTESEDTINFIQLSAQRRVSQKTLLYPEDDRLAAEKLRDYINYASRSASPTYKESYQKLEKSMNTGEAFGNLKVAFEKLSHELKTSKEDESNKELLKKARAIFADFTVLFAEIDAITHSALTPIVELEQVCKQTCLIKPKELPIIPEEGKHNVPLPVPLSKKSSEEEDDEHEHEEHQEEHEEEEDDDDVSVENEGVNKEDEEEDQQMVVYIPGGEYQEHPNCAVKRNNDGMNLLLKCLAVALLTSTYVAATQNF